jgi:hypothetical protein
MDPREVDSAQDVRDGWDEWSYGERADALDALANANLDRYGYDGANVRIGDIDTSGSYDDGEITIDDDLLVDSDPDSAIHSTDHETIHAMNDQDGIEDGVNVSDYDEDYVFNDEESQAIANHTDVGDQARTLDHDGSLGRGSGGSAGGAAGPPGSTTANAGGSEYDGGSDAPSSDELTAEIDWASGVWVDSTSADGSSSVDIYFSPMEGW